jgi:hypothetical protein
MDDSSSQDELTNDMNEDNTNVNIDENESKNKILFFNFVSSIIGEELFPFPLRFVFYIVESCQLLSLAFYNEVTLYHQLQIFYLKKILLVNTNMAKCKYLIPNREFFFLFHNSQSFQFDELL